MPHVRVTRDERGYETTFLLHVRWPGARPQVLYWYRSAPGLRVGRSALDEDAIRTIEEQYPEIEFDWEHLIEASTMLPPEVERRPERPRRKALRAAEPEPVMAVEPGEPDRPVEAEAPARRDEPTPPPLTDRHHTLLDELVGREIAARLRARHAELMARLAEVTDPARRAEWQARADALDPDSWQTPEAILDGVQQADRRFDDLRKDME